MLRFLPDWLVGSIALALGCISTLLIFIFIVLPPALAKILIPVPIWRHACTDVLVMGTTLWANTVTACINLARQPEWDIEGLDGPNPSDSYLLISNHATWTDIAVLLRIFPGHFPFPRFFIKQQLIWLPIIGFCAWAIDCPFMRRYSHEELEKHPEWRGKDLETTRRSCEKFRHHDTTIVNFAEGTRFTRTKHATRKSPFRNLLRPKAGGVAFMLNAMGDQFDAILNMTIAYPPDNDATFWDHLCGRIRKISVRIEKIPVPPEFMRGNYQEDPVFQKNFQAWITALWERKDALIDELHAQM